MFYLKKTEYFTLFCGGEGVGVKFAVCVCMFLRNARLLIRPAGRAGPGRVGSGQKIYRSGRVQFGQKLKFNFTLKCLVSVFYFAF